MSYFRTQIVLWEMTYVASVTAVLVHFSLTEVVL